MILAVVVCQLWEPLTPLPCPSPCFWGDYSHPVIGQYSLHCLLPLIYLKKNPLFIVPRSSDQLQLQLSFGHINFLPTVSSSESTLHPGILPLLFSITSRDPQCYSCGFIIIALRGKGTKGWSCSISLPLSISTPLELPHIQDMWVSHKDWTRKRGWIKYSSASSAM